MKPIMFELKSKVGAISIVGRSDVSWEYLGRLYDIMILTTLNFSIEQAVKGLDK